jgi:hypothetical protein
MFATLKKATANVSGAFARALSACAAATVCELSFRPCSQRIAAQIPGAQ